MSKSEPTSAPPGPVTGLSPARAAAVPMLAGAGLLFGTWALLPRYVGPELELGPRGPMLEFIDHTVPGAIVIALSLLALVRGRPGRPGAPSLLFYAGLGVAVAGVWMTATHIPLVKQALQGQAPWDATLHHSLPSAAVLLFGVGWCLLYRVRGDGKP